MARQYQDRAWLETQYVANGKTTGEIASEADCSRETIRRWLHKHDIPVRQRGMKAGDTQEEYEELHDEEWLKQHYIKEEKTAEQIAYELGCVQQSVINALDRYEIDRRDSGNSLYDTLGSHIDKRLSDEEWLVENYVNQENAIADIADMMDVTPPAVKYWLDKYDIPRRGAKQWSNTDTIFQRDPEWDKRRKKRLEIDDHTCQDCGVTESEYSRSLDVHHKRPKQEFVRDDGTVDWEEANAVENLISLCRSCHIKRHTNA